MASDATIAARSNGRRWDDQYLTQAIVSFCTVVMRCEKGIDCLLSTIAKVCWALRNAVTAILGAETEYAKLNISTVIHAHSDSVQWKGSMNFELLGKYAKKMLPRTTVVGGGLRFEQEKANEIADFVPDSTKSGRVRMFDWDNNPWVPVNTYELNENHILHGFHALQNAQSEFVIGKWTFDTATMAEFIKTANSDEYLAQVVSCESERHFCSMQEKYTTRPEICFVDFVEVDEDTVVVLLVQF